MTINDQFQSPNANEHAYVLYIQYTIYIHTYAQHTQCEIQKLGPCDSLL